LLQNVEVDLGALQHRLHLTANFRNDGEKHIAVLDNTGILRKIRPSGLGQSIDSSTNGVLHGGGLVLFPS
jgi:hypothetical protein